MPFFKLEGDFLTTASLSVEGPGIELLADNKDIYVYPVQGWYWFDTIEQAMGGLTNQADDPTLLTIEERQRRIWNLIQQERDVNKFKGVKVGDYWFHSDPDSRTQQLALVMMGSNIPPGLLWKVKSPGGGLFNPTYVTMSQSLALQIYNATVESDKAIYTAAELHRNQLLAAPVPEEYDYKINWPAGFNE